jgi:hypothetical protein
MISAWGLRWKGTGSADRPVVPSVPSPSGALGQSGDRGGRAVQDPSMVLARLPRAWGALCCRDRGLASLGWVRERLVAFSKSIPRKSWNAVGDRRLIGGSGYAGSTARPGDNVYWNARLIQDFSSSVGSSPAFCRISSASERQWLSENLRLSTAVATWAS